LHANDPAQSSHDLDPSAGSVSIRAPIDTNGGAFQTSGAAFASTPAGTLAAGNVALDHPGGTIGIGAWVAASSLIAKGASTIAVKDATRASPSVATQAGQDYQGPVTLAESTVLRNTATGEVAFESTVDGAADGNPARVLAITGPTGNARFEGRVGATPL